MVKDPQITQISFRGGVIGIESVQMMSAQFQPEDFGGEYLRIFILLLRIPRWTAASSYPGLLIPGFSFLAPAIRFPFCLRGAE